MDIFDTVVEFLRGTNPREAAALSRASGAIRAAEAHFKAWATGEAEVRMADTAATAAKDAVTTLDAGKRAAVDQFAESLKKSVAAGKAGATARTNEVAHVQEAADVAVGALIRWEAEAVRPSRLRQVAVGAFVTMVALLSVWSLAGQPDLRLECEGTPLICKGSAVTASPIPAPSASHAPTPSLPDDDTPVPTVDETATSTATPAAGIGVTISSPVDGGDIPTRQWLIVRGTAIGTT